MWRATGSTSARSPSRTARPTALGIDASSSAAVCGERLDLPRGALERRLEVGRSGRRAPASAIRCWARSSASASMGATLLSAPDGRRAELDYELPPELIAQRPLEPRDESRLLVYDRGDRARSSTAASRELPEELPPDELVVVNDTRVVPARLRLRRPAGGAVEVLLLERARTTGSGRRSPGRRGGCAPGCALGPVELARAARRAGAGWCGSRASRPARRRCRRTSTSRSPIPSATRPSTRDEPGSAAAPTAGLHFTPELARAARRRARHAARRPRHVPAGDGRRRSSEHELHGERYAVEPSAWERIAAADRVLAVGTTTVRVLETVARGGAARGPHDALRHAGLRVPAGRRAADELPPAALDAARARDGVRRRRGDARALPRSRSPSATASTRSATRCSSCDGAARDARHGSGTIRVPCATLPDRLEAGGGAGWPRESSPSVTRRART